GSGQGVYTRFLHHQLRSRTPRASGRQTQLSGQNAPALSFARGSISSMSQAAVSAVMDGFFSTSLAQKDPDLYRSIAEELHRQQDQIELIASENIVSAAVLEAQGSVLTNKYAEGYPGRRYYGGCEVRAVAGARRHGPP